MARQQQTAVKLITSTTAGGLNTQIATEIAAGWTVTRDTFLYSDGTNIVLQMVKIDKNAVSERMAIKSAIVTNHANLAGFNTDAATASALGKELYALSDDPGGSSYWSLFVTR